MHAKPGRNHISCVWLESRGKGGAGPRATTADLFSFSSSFLLLPVIFQSVCDLAADQSSWVGTKASEHFGTGLMGSTDGRSGYLVFGSAAPSVSTVRSLAELSQRPDGTRK